MTKNQARMGLKKMKTGQKLVVPLRDLMERAGDDLDREDPDYLEMVKHLKDCALEMEQVVVRMERYVAGHVRS